MYEKLYISLSSHLYGCKRELISISLLFPAMESSAAVEKAKTGDKPPRIVDHAQSQIVKDGDTVTLSCRYELCGT